MIKGGRASPGWGVKITRFPVSLQKMVSIEGRKAFLQLMEMKFVVILYDGDISFPNVWKSGHKKAKPTHSNLEYDMPSLCKALNEQCILF